LAQAVHAGERSAQLGSNLVITATAQAGHTAKELEQAIDAEIAGLKTKPPTDQEVERARAHVQMAVLQQLESPFGVADALNEMQFALGDPLKINTRYLGRYDALTAKDLARVAQQVFAAPHVVISVAPAPQAAEKKGGM